MAMHSGRLDLAGAREWLCTNGLGGFASGTVAGLLTCRYHGLLVAALTPPFGRTLLVARLDETVAYDGTTPVWDYAVTDALVEKRVFMEPGANTTYVRYRLVRGRVPARLSLKALANQGPVWGWLLGPFALAHARAYGDTDGVGSIAETLRAWHVLVRDQA